MSKELVLQSGGNIPSAQEMETIINIVKYCVDSKYLEKIGGISQGIAIALYAREMGLPLMSCLFGGIRPVLGRVEIAPQMMNAMIRKAGHELKTVFHDDQKCVIWGRRKDTGEEKEVTFTIEDAKRAAIYKGAWLAYPKNMTYKSALSNLARWLFPDVIGMAGVEGEFQDDAFSPQQKPEATLRQKQKIEPISDQKTIEVAAIEEKPKEMNVAEFAAFMASKKADLEINEELAQQFLNSQSTSRQVPIPAIIQQATKPDLVNRFINTYQTWLDAKKDSEILVAQS